MTEPLDFRKLYNTQLSHAEEQQFQEWAAANKRQNDDYDYDIRGAWKELSAGDMKAADNGHLGDKYKKPNHPTFSDESIYNGVDGHFGGSWRESNGKYEFHAGETQRKLWDTERLQSYFDQREPDVQLVYPEVQSLRNAK